MAEIVTVPGEELIMCECGDPLSKHYNSGCTAYHHGVEKYCRCKIPHDAVAQIAQLRADNAALLAALKDLQLSVRDGNYMMSERIIDAALKAHGVTS